jgi:hypothetical protein
MCGHLKALVYAVPVYTKEGRHLRIKDACQTIRNQPDIFQRMRRFMMRRVEARTESQGGKTFSANVLFQP